MIQFCTDISFAKTDAIGTPPAEKPVWMKKMFWKYHAEAEHRGEKEERAGIRRKEQNGVNRRQKHGWFMNVNHAPPAIFGMPHQLSG